MKALFLMFKTVMFTLKNKFLNIMYILKAHLNYFNSCNNEMTLKSMLLKCMRQCKRAK